MFLDLMMDRDKIGDLLGKARNKSWVDAFTSKLSIDIVLCAYTPSSSTRGTHCTADDSQSRGQGGFLPGRFWKCASKCSGQARRLIFVMFGWN